MTIFDELESGIMSNSSIISMQREKRCGQVLEAMHACGMD